MPLLPKKPSKTIAVDEIFDALNSREYSLEIDVSSSLYLEMKKLNSYLNSLCKATRHHIFEIKTKGLSKNEIDEQFQSQLRIFISTICTEPSWLKDVCPSRSEKSHAREISQVLNGRMIDIRTERQQKIISNK